MEAKLEGELTLFAHEVMAAMLDDKNQSICLLWEVNSLFM